MGEVVKTFREYFKCIDESVDDSLYMKLASDPQKNRDALQRMVDAAADSAGYAIKAFHGTDSLFASFDPGFWESDKGFYFTTNEHQAADYGEYVLEVRLRCRKPYKMSARKWLATRNPSVDDMRSKGYDGIFVPDYDSGNNDTIYDDTGDMYVIFDAENIKLADPVTYIDGNIVPLSKRFDVGSNNINESLDRSVFNIGPVYHGTMHGDVKFHRSSGFGMHFGTKKAAEDRKQHTKEDNVVAQIANASTPEYDETDKTWHYWIGDEYAGGFPTREAALADRNKEIGARPYDDDEGNVGVFYLSLKNPLRWPDVHFDAPFDFADMPYVANKLKQYGHGKPKLSTVQMKRIQDMRTMADVRKYLQSLGYDGVVYANHVEDQGSDSYIVFEPSQVRRVRSADSKQ